MIYLLDVNALVALGFAEHEFHTRVAHWARTLEAAAELGTCAITELGFVRILAQAPQYSISVEQGRTLLGRLKAEPSRSFRFLLDALGAERLPKWVKSGRQTTDGHLAELATAHGGRLATLDQGIPGAYLIPGSKDSHR